MLLLLFHSNCCDRLSIYTGWHFCSVLIYLVCDNARCGDLLILSYYKKLLAGVPGLTDTQHQLLWEALALSQIVIFCLQRIDRITHRPDKTGIRFSNNEHSETACSNIAAIIIIIMHLRLVSLLRFACKSFCSVAHRWRMTRCCLGVVIPPIYSKTLEM